MVKLKSLPPMYFVVSLINHLLTVFIDSLYSTLKMVTKPFDIYQKKATFQDNADKINSMGIAHNFHAIQYVHVCACIDVTLTNHDHENRQHICVHSKMLLVVHIYHYVH